MGFGTEMLLLAGLGFLLLGPKQMHTMLGHLGRAKAEIEKVSHGFKAQLAADLESDSRDRQ